MALLRRASLSSRVTGIAISLRTSVALAAAFWNESEIVVGWIPAVKKLEGGTIIKIINIVIDLSLDLYETDNDTMISVTLPLTFFEEVLASVEQAASNDDHSGSTITSFYILGFGQLH